MSIGYSLGSLALILYSAMCIYIGVKKPEKMINLVRKKLMNKISKEAAAKLCIIFGIIALISAFILLVLGFINN